MRRFITAGLVGTAQSGSELPPDLADTDALAGDTRKEGIEQTYLLRAGMAAVYGTAGYVPQRLTEPQKTAPVERLPICNPAVEGLIWPLVRANRLTLLAEALALLHRAGQVASPALLPELLELRDPRMRAAVTPVLGERGRWLSQFNPTWRWVAQTADGGPAELPEDAETLWSDGTTGERVKILTWLRMSSPEQARQWLVDVWKHEKADNRTGFLRSFEFGLSADDEPLLESALDDRAESVRATAADLLARLPESAFVRRMAERAESMLTLTQTGIEAKPPTQLPDDWRRDNVGRQVDAGRGARAEWLSDVLATVPCAVWSARFGRTPDELVAAVAESTWRDAVLEGWTRAAARYEDRDWAPVLWRYWAMPGSSREMMNRIELRSLVSPLVASAEIEAHAAGYFTSPSSSRAALFQEALSAVPTPWSASFGHAFLSALSAYTAALDPATKRLDGWESAVHDASFALPPACFEEALRLPLAPESDQRVIQYFHAALDDFSSTIRLRKQLHQEIRPL